MATPKLEINGTDVSSYVVRIDDVPINDNNRNLEPIASGFTCDISDAYTNSIAVGQKVEFFLDSTAHFRGYVAFNKYDYQRKVKVITVNHVLMLLENKYVDYTTLNNVLVQTDSSSIAKTISSINTSTDFLTSVGHGYINGDALLFYTTDTLPNPLIGGRYYYVVNKTTDTFQLSTSYSGSVINISTSGSGTITCKEADKSKYNYRDFDGYPNVSVSWLTEKLFEIAGMSINSSSVDSTVKYTVYSDPGGSAYPVDWREIILDENMLYSINQSVASYFNVIVDADIIKSYFPARVSCLSLLSFIIGKLGFRIKYTGSETFTLTNWTNTVYSLSSDDKLKYSSYTDYGENNTAYGAESYNNNRDNYSTNTTAGATFDISDGYSFNGSSGNYNNINWWTNLIFFLRSGSGDILTSAYTPANYWRIDQASTYSINAIEGDWLVEEIEAPIQASNVNIKSEFIDVDRRRSIIVQETMS